MRTNKRGKGLPVDSMSKRPIGQSEVFTLTENGAVEPVSETNPLPAKIVQTSKETASMSGPIVVTSAASVKIADANPTRSFFFVHIDGSEPGAWVKLQPATTDDDKKGIWIEGKVGKRDFWHMDGDNIYTGEISAIAQTADVNIYVTEF